MKKATTAKMISFCTCAPKIKLAKVENWLPEISVGAKVAVPGNQFKTQFISFRAEKAFFTSQDLPVTLFPALNTGFISLVCNY